MLIVERGTPTHPQAAALLQQSHALMQSLFNPEDNHYLSIDALCAPHIRFFMARRGDQVLGTGALAIMHDYGEVKSMFVAPDARGQGVAQALLRQIEDEARQNRLPLLRLETGDKLAAAHRLYHGAGFQLCPPFGDYTANASSVFMQKPLD